jgi:hypothetical protein
MQIGLKATAGVAAALALTGLGVAAGTVIGSDGSAELADRISGDYGPAEEVRVEIPAARAQAESAKKAKKPRVIHGVGATRTVPAGDSDTVSLICPTKFPVPLSGGLRTSAPGIFPGVIERSTSGPGMFIAVVNISNAELSWEPTAACAKGMKEG